MQQALFARHGESECSARSLLNGDPSLPCPLSERGREQAVALGRELSGQELELCVTTRFERTIETAELAIGERGLPWLELPELGDPRYGVYEGRPIEEYRAWATAARSSEQAPGGGESRHELVARYVRGLGAIAARPERALLVVCHSLPIAYLIAATQGSPPRPRAELVEYATPYAFTPAELAAAVATLEAWLRAPDW